MTRTFRSSTFEALRVPLAFIVSGYVLLQLMTRHQLIAPGRLLAFLVAGAVCAWLATTARTRLALGVIVLYLGAVDGFVKLRTGSSTVTVARDMLLYSLAVGMLLRALIGSRKMRLPPYAIWPIAYALVVVAQLANPESAALSVLGAVQALRPLIEFLPLFFLAYVLVDSRRTLERLLLILVVIGALNGVVGVVQSQLTPAQLSSWGPGYATLIGGTGEYAGSARTFTDASGTKRSRPPALGSDLGFGGAIGVLALPAALALLAGAATRRTQLAAFVGLAGIAAAILSSQSRSAILIAIVAAFAYLLLTAGTRQRAAATIAIGVGLAVGVAVISLLISNTNSSLIDRYKSISPGQLLATGKAERAGPLKLLPKLVAEIPLGGGLAQSGPAGKLRPKAARAGYNAENGLNAAVIETGVPGLVILIGGGFAILFMAIRRLRRVPDTETRRYLAALAAALVGYAVFSLVASPYSGTPGGPLLFGGLGILAGVAGGRSPLLKDPTTRT